MSQEERSHQTGALNRRLDPVQYSYHQYKVGRSMPLDRDRRAVGWWHLARPVLFGAELVDLPRTPKFIAQRDLLANCTPGMPLSAVAARFCDSGDG